MFNNSRLAYPSFFPVLLFVLVFSCWVTPASAMTQTQVNEVASFCNAKTNQPAASVIGQSNANWVYDNTSLLGTNKKCDPTEPTSKTSWCEVKTVSCQGGSVYHDSAVCTPANGSTGGTGSEGLLFTGGHCAQLSAASASGCSSPDNAGICDQITEARTVASRADATAMSIAAEQSSTTAAVENLGNNLNIGLGQYNAYTNSFWSYSQIVDDMRMWTKWGVDTDIANWNQQKAMMQTQLQQGDAYLAALEQVKQAVLTGGSTEINLTDVTNALANQTDQEYLLGSVRNQALNSANILASSLNDKIDDSNDTAIEIKNVLQGMATNTNSSTQTVNTGLELLHNDAINQQNIQDQISDQLGGVSGDLFTIKSSLQQIANNTANPPTSPPVTIDTSAMQSLQAGTNARIDGLAGQVAGVGAGVASLNSTASTIASNTGAVASSLGGVSQSTIDGGTADFNSSVNSSASGLAGSYNSASASMLSGAMSGAGAGASIINQIRQYVTPTITTTGGCTLPALVFMEQSVELSLCEYMDMFRYLGMLLFFFANMRSIMIILSWIRGGS